MPSTTGWAASTPRNDDQSLETANSGRKPEPTEDLFTVDHVLHDRSYPADPAPQGVADAVRTYQEGVDGHWQVEEMLSAGDGSRLRWTGTGTHNGDRSGISAADGSREVWVTLGLLQQMGVVPTS